MSGRGSLLLVGIVACHDKGWTEREQKPTSLDLGGGVKLTVSVPDGLKRTNAEGDASARFESIVEGGPFVSVYADASNLQELVTVPPPGSTGLDKRELPDGYGFLYAKDGPHVHLTRKIGKSTINCDGFFLGTNKDDLERADMLWKICASVK